MSELKDEVDDSADMEQLMRMLQQAVFDSVVECSTCGMRLEPDYLRCPECGEENPLQRAGLI